jgi:NAD dependent epimerase/dehydratase family enzyme
MIVGLGIFGTFISLIGSALVSAMHEAEQNSVTLSRSIVTKLKQLMKDLHEPDDIEYLKQQCDQAVLDYIAARQNQQKGFKECQ